MASSRGDTAKPFGAPQFGISMFPDFFEGTKNFDITTYRMGGTQEERYRDLHVRNKAKALEWLRTQAPKYRGKAERLYAQHEWPAPLATSDLGEGNMGLAELFNYLMNKAKTFRDNRRLE